MTQRSGLGSAKRWRDSQGSLPKTADDAYVDDNATEL
jgi:hypothetical protein